MKNLLQTIITTSNFCYVSSRNLMANPFNCNCHLGWLAEWLKKRNVITGTPTCTAPHAVKDTPIQDLKPKDFACEGILLFTLTT